MRRDNILKGNAVMRRGLVLILADRGGQVYGGALKKFNESYVLYPLEGADTLYVLTAADLAIIDCDSLVDQGLRLLRRIKRRFPSMPVIFITAASSEEVILQALKAGVREYFRKPVDVAELLESVATILSLKRDTPWTHIPLSTMKNERETEIHSLNDELPERLLRVIQFIEINLPNHLCLDKIAQQACLSKFHFSRLFKQHLGVSPIQFIRNLRIYRATDLLRSTNLAIATVAEQTGFNDLSDFYRRFKKVHGMPPSDFRKSLSPPNPPFQISKIHN